LYFCTDFCHVIYLRIQIWTSVLLNVWAKIRKIIAFDYCQT
jgi:hypothetical protein